MCPADTSCVTPQNAKSVLTPLPRAPCTFPLEISRHHARHARLAPRRTADHTPHARADSRASLYPQM